MIVWLMLSLSVAAATPATPAPPAWSAGLTPEQRQLLLEVAGEEFCACQSALTLAGCLQSRPHCALAGQLATVLARGVAAGAPAASLRSVLAEQIVQPLCAASVPLALPASAPRLGTAQAPLQVVEFADFRCGHCREAVPEVHRAVAALGKRVSLVYLPVSMGGDPGSLGAAEAAPGGPCPGQVLAHARGPVRR